jgi:tRNA U38,U39,U40 pseudouridine synthase TruA
MAVFALQHCIQILMAKKVEPASPMDELRIRFIEVLDAIMRDNPKVRTVKAVAREIDCPYLSLHKVYNYRKYKSSYPSSDMILMTVRLFPTINPDFLLTNAEKLYRDAQTSSKLSELEAEVHRIKRKIGLK